MRNKKLRVVLVKPSKYGPDGYVERFRWGFMPNSTLPYIRTLTPKTIEGVPLEVFAIDEYIETNGRYLDLLRADEAATLAAFIGTQSHQFPRALDLAALAHHHGCMAVIGGPHPMTCQTTEMHGKGISFALSEADLDWINILTDAVRFGELQPVYGQNRRWAPVIDPPVLQPPSKQFMKKHIRPMLGIYHSRGCPYTCEFCSVIEIAGRNMRAQPIGTTIKSLLAAKSADVKQIMFTADNFNKTPQVKDLLREMIERQINLPFFVQCDAQVWKDEELFEYLGRAGCRDMFVGAESFSETTLRKVHKMHNHPRDYKRIVALCRQHHISPFFSNIIGFEDDTKESIQSHMQELVALDPNSVAFYTLTPIPGTKQYGRFLQNRWITEKLLDRFDGTWPTWQHPNLTWEQLAHLLYDCYEKFYQVPKTIRRVISDLKNGKRISQALTTLGSLAFYRYCAGKKMHPMSGGFLKVQFDRAKDYLDLRLCYFGFKDVPLPENLPLPAAEQALNQNVKLAT